MDESEQAIKHIAAALGIKRAHIQDDEIVGAIIAEIVYLKQAYAKSLDELFKIKQYVESQKLQSKGGDAP